MAKHSDGSRATPAPAEPSDGQLVRATLDGDRSCFDVLIRRYQRQAVAVSYRLLGNTNDALEVAQDAMLKAFGGWLMRIVSNLSLNYRRSRKTRRQLPLDELLSPSGSESSETTGAGASSEWMARSGDPHREAAGHELGKRLQEALDQLPEKQRLAIVLFTIQELPQKEVAETLGCSVEAVKWHVFQGRKKLKELLKDVM
jgi:RNA polymerase sigma-70 factor (ECF subfamily)